MVVRATITAVLALACNLVLSSAYAAGGPVRIHAVQVVAQSGITLFVGEPLCVLLDVSASVDDKGESMRPAARVC